MLLINAAVVLGLIVAVSVPALLSATPSRVGRPEPTVTVTVPVPQPTVTVTVPRPRPGPTVTVTDLRPGPTVTVVCRHPGRRCGG